MIRTRQALAEMGALSILLCIILAASTCTVVSSDSQSVQRGAQQLTEELLRDRRQASSSSPESKSDDGLGALLAQQAAQLSSLKDKLHALEISQLTAKSELQSELQSTKSELQSTKSELRSTKSDLLTAKGELQTSQAKIETKMEKLKKGKGSSFVRWGRTTCPNTTALVYTGVVGGKQHNHKGGGTNTLCLTRTPQFDNTAKPSKYGYLYGTEYEQIPGHHDHDVPCSVCLAPQSTTTMVPATLTCPPGWTPHYTGHLASGSSYHTHYATEYVCLDGSPENDSSGVRNDNGLLFYLVVTVCGSLPCPPYINDKVVTCVVCSK